MLDILAKYEPLWLFLLILVETIYTVRLHRMARIEFEYDKEWNERKAARRKRQFNFESLTSGEHK